MNDSFSRRLKQTRLNAGITQSDLARRVGVSAQAIQHLESGKAQSTKHVLKIAGVLSVNPAWLQDGIGSPKQSGNFTIPAREGQLEKALERRIHASVWNGPSDEVQFPAKLVDYRESIIPVFFATPYAWLEIPNATKRQQESQLSKWLEINREKIGDEISAMTRYGFYVIDSREPNEYTPRPHYLDGQLEAYALFLNGPKQLTDRIGDAEILHVSSYKRADEGDLVVLWHKSNTFTVGEFDHQSANAVFLKDKNFIVNPEESWDGAQLGCIEFLLDEVEATHTVVGAEHSLPRSAGPLQFGLFRRRIGPDEDDLIWAEDAQKNL